MEKEFLDNQYENWSIHEMKSHDCQSKYMIFFLFNIPDKTKTTFFQQFHVDLSVFIKS